MKTKSPWRFNRGTLTLQLFNVRGHLRYEVDLERCKTSAAVLDWITQIAGKTWADDSTLAGLVRDLNRILDPQANLCSLGVEQGPIDVSALVSKKKRGK